MKEWKIKWHNSISDINKSDWNKLAFPLESPALEWEWLHAMEESKSISAETGWQPSHLTVWQEKELIAAVPLYIKSHSNGEFVFDFIWVDVAYKLQIEYYPKLVSVYPATPIAGFQFLIDEQISKTEMTNFILNEIDLFCKNKNIKSSNILYTKKEWTKELINNNYLPWQHQHFIWENNGFNTFDDYINSFNKNQRHNIKKETNAMEKAGINFKYLTGDDIPDYYFSIMYDYYLNTNMQFGIWAAKFLNRDFFLELAENFKNRILFIAAFLPDQDDPAALSMILIKNKNMYGRYWGCRMQIKFLHFNLCYYLPIKWAIENNIKYFDPGIGGEHKVRRGFKSFSSYSLHKFYNETMHEVFKYNINKVNEYEQSNIEILNSVIPYRK